MRVRARRGPPTPAETTLLSTAVRGDGGVTLDHRRGQEAPGLLTLAFEMSERGWLTHPSAPELVGKTLRRWRFEVTASGRAAYASVLATYR